MGMFVFKPYSEHAESQDNLGYATSLNEERAKELFKDARFLQDVLDFYRERDGLEFSTAEEAFEKFWSDRSWRNLHTGGMAKEWVQASNMPDAQKYRLARLQSVYEAHPNFYEEGGLGWKRFWNNAGIMLTDPINLVGFGLGGQAARGAAYTAKMAGQNAFREGMRAGVKRAAKGEAAVGAGAMGVFDYAHQGRNIELGLQDERSWARTGLHALGGGFVGAGFGAAMGVPAAAAPWKIWKPKPERSNIRRGIAEAEAKLAEGAKASIPKHTDASFVDEAATSTPVRAAEHSPETEARGAAVQAEARRVIDLENESKTPEERTAEATAEFGSPEPRAPSPMEQSLGALNAIHAWPQIRVNWEARVAKAIADGDEVAARKLETEIARKDTLFEEYKQALLRLEEGDNLALVETVARRFVEPTPDEVPMGGIPPDAPASAGGARATAAAATPEAEAPPARADTEAPETTTPAPDGEEGPDVSAAAEWLRKVREASPDDETPDPHDLRPPAHVDSEGVPVPLDDTPDSAAWRDRVLGRTEEGETPDLETMIARRDEIHNENVARGREISKVKKQLEAAEPDSDEAKSLKDSLSALEEAHTVGKADAKQARQAVIDAKKAADETVVADAVDPAGDAVPPSMGAAATDATTPEGAAVGRATDEAADDFSRSEPVKVSNRQLVTELLDGELQAPTESVMDIPSAIALTDSLNKKELTQVLKDLGADLDAMGALPRKGTPERRAMVEMELRKLRGRMLWINQFQDFADSPKVLFQTEAMRGLLSLQAKHDDVMKNAALDAYDVFLGQHSRFIMADELAARAWPVDIDDEAWRNLVDDIRSSYGEEIVSLVLRGTRLDMLPMAEGPLPKVKTAKEFNLTGGAALEYRRWTINYEKTLIARGLTESEARNQIIALSGVRAESLRTSANPKDHQTGAPQIRTSKDFSLTEEQAATAEAKGYASHVGRVHVGEYDKMKGRFDHLKTKLSRGTITASERVELRELVVGIKQTSNATTTAGRLQSALRKSIGAQDNDYTYMGNLFPRIRQGTESGAARFDASESAHRQIETAAFTRATNRNIWWRL